MYLLNIVFVKQKNTYKLSECLVELDSWHS